MKELEGRQPFGQGLYHCNSYENLIKNLTIDESSNSMAQGGGEQV